jgi:hypothetical protein
MSKARRQKRSFLYLRNGFGRRVALDFAAATINSFCVLLFSYNRERNGSPFTARLTFLARGSDD